MADFVDDRIARRNVWVLVAAQAVLGSQMSILFIVAALSGQRLAPNPCLATLPITMIFVGSMSAAPLLSAYMQRHGRRAGFTLGVFAALAGGMVSAIAVYLGSFYLLMAGSFFTGIYMSAQGFYRFAATDRASEDFRPKAISYVLGGGLAAAIIGPQIVKATAEATVIPFLGTYMAVGIINLIGLGILRGLDIPVEAVDTTAANGGRSRREHLRDPVVRVAIICAAVSFALMNLVMTSTPIAVVGCGYSTANAADIISAHVLAMYAPSFVTGHLIRRFGVIPIISTGLTLLAGAGLVALNGVALENFFVALVLLGIGWNFGFIGATTLLTSVQRPEEKSRVQGLNDAVVFGCVVLASMASGGLMNCSGGDVVQGWSAVNLAMAPLLALAGGALIWLVMRGRQAV